MSASTIAALAYYPFVPFLIPRDSPEGIEILNIRGDLSVSEVSSRPKVKFQILRQVIQYMKREKPISDPVQLTEALRWLRQQLEGTVRAQVGFGDQATWEKTGEIARYLRAMRDNIPDCKIATAVRARGRHFTIMVGTTTYPGEGVIVTGWTEHTLETI